MGRLPVANNASKVPLQGSVVCADDDKDDDSLQSQECIIHVPDFFLTLTHSFFHMS